MALRKCEHCGNVFWVNNEARSCALCGVAEKTEEKTTERQEESSDRQLQPVGR